MTGQYIEAHFVPFKNEDVAAKRSEGRLIIEGVAYECICYNRKYTRIFLPLSDAAPKFKFKFNKDMDDGAGDNPVEALLGELEQGRVAGQMSVEKCKEYEKKIFVLYDGTHQHYGVNMPYIEGENLEYWINKVIERAPRKVDATDEVLHLFRGVLRTYQELKRQGSLPLDFSLGNIMSRGGETSAEEWSWIAVDNREHIDNGNHVHGDERVRTKADWDVERLLSNRRKYNQVFFFAFHTFLHDCLLRVLKRVRNQECDVLASHKASEYKSLVTYNNGKVRQLQKVLIELGDFDPEDIPKSGNHRSSDELFISYDKKLNDLLVIASNAPVELVVPLTAVESAAWKRLQERKRVLVAVEAALARLGNATDLCERITQIISQIPDVEPHSLVNLKPLRVDINKLFLDLYADPKIREHRNSKENRKGGEKEFFSSIPPALRLLIGFTLLGAIVLLGLYLAQEAPTTREKLVKQQVNHSVGMLSQIAKERRRVAKGLSSLTPCNNVLTKNTQRLSRVDKNEQPLSPRSRSHSL